MSHPHRTLRPLALTAAFLAGIFAQPAWADNASSFYTDVFSSSYDWSGNYAGLTFGGDWGSTHRNYSDGTDYSFNTSGVLGGLTVGHNWQIQNIVIGLEGDFSGNSGQGTTRLSNANLDKYQTANAWMATIRPRVGYAFGRFFPYATAGLAVGDISVKTTRDATGVVPLNFDRLEPGWTAGAGAELGLNENWTLKCEYLHTQFADANGPSSNPAVTTSTSLNQNIVRIGVNYRF